MTKRDQEMMDQIAAKLTPEEWKWVADIPQALSTCGQLVELNHRLVRWARQDPRGAQENLYALVGEIERLIGE